MSRSRRPRMANPTPWWAMSAVALLVATVAVVTRSPVEIGGMLIMAAALGVLGAAVSTRRRRLAVWPERSGHSDSAATSP